MTQCPLHVSFNFVNYICTVYNLSKIFTFDCFSGNHERDWPDSGSYYNGMDSGGECGVLAETMFYVPAKNRAKYW